MTWVALGAAGVGVAGSIGGALIGSNAAGNAADTAQAGSNQGVLSILSGQQAATGAIQPYAQTGEANNSFLAYLMGQGAPTSSGWTSSDASQLASLQQIANAVSNQSNFSAHPADASYLTSLDQQIAQLQNQQQASQVATQANNQISASGLPQGYFEQAASHPFSYDPTTDPLLQSAAGLTAETDNALASVYGGVGSGNTVDTINQNILTADVPQYENLALQQYNQNYVTNPQNLYNMLSGQSQSGQNAGNALANIYTGGAANIAQLQGNAANAAASGITGSANALSNGLTGLGNTAQSAAGTYLNNQSQQSLYNLIAQMQNGGGGGGGSSYSYDPTAGVNMADPYAALYSMNGG